MGRRQQEDEAQSIGEAPAEAEASKVEALTVEKLAAKHGQLQPAPIAGDSPFSAAHAVADLLHGWAHHKLYVGGEVTMSDADYLAALEAAAQGKTHAAAFKGELSKEQAEALHASAKAESKKRALAKGGK